jgi:hypothetical protein
VDTSNRELINQINRRDQFDEMVRNETIGSLKDLFYGMIMGKNNFLDFFLFFNFLYSFLF